MAETIGDRIKRLRLAKGLTQEELGKMCYTSKQTIFKYETGAVTNIPIPRVQLLARSLGVTAADLAQIEGYVPEGFEPVPSTHQVPVLGSIACGDPALAVQTADEYTDAPVACDFVLRCHGDSMIDAGIHDGDIVYIKAQPTVDNGEIAAVVVGDSATLKRVYITDTVVTLMPCNVLYKPLVYTEGSRADIRIVGKAVAFTHAL